MDVYFERCNKIKLLIRCKANITNFKPLKLIKNRSTYNLNFQKYEGRILEIIRLDDERKNSFNMLPRSSFSMWQEEFELEEKTSKISA